MIGIIGGGSLKLKGFSPGEERTVSTPYGFPSSPLYIGRWRGREIVVIFRHGPEGRIPPHRINHRANIHALGELGVEAVVGVNSVGSLREEIPPGVLVIPHDFLSPWSVLTFFEDEAVHVTPGLDEGVRTRLIEAASRASVEHRPEGIYIQTIGPRLETKAEIAFLKHLGDVVGMTMAHEATLCAERGIPYGSLCTVDNYAHGIVEEPLSEAQIKSRAAANAEKAAAVLEEFLSWAS